MTRAVVWVGVGALLALGCSPSVHRWTRPDGVTQEVMSHDRGLQPCPRGGSDHCDCDSDGDCAERPGGECHPGFPDGGTTGYDPGLVQTCRYAECRADVDCGEGALCIPRGFLAPVERCIAATCRSSADCTRAAGGACRVMSTERRGATYEAHCVYPDDPCDPVGGRGCAPMDDSSGDAREQQCVFSGGAARCAPVPDPVP